MQEPDWAAHSHTLTQPYRSVEHMYCPKLKVLRASQVCPASPASPSPSNFHMVVALQSLRTGCRLLQHTRGSFFQRRRSNLELPNLCRHVMMTCSPSARQQITAAVLALHSPSPVGGRKDEETEEKADFAPKSIRALQSVRLSTTAHQGQEQSAREAAR